MPSRDNDPRWKEELEQEEMQKYEKPEKVPEKKVVMMMDVPTTIKGITFSNQICKLIVQPCLIVGHFVHII